jgi:demethylmenaquinone methyltransferase/2-methoxy-6-polyprenyl-1,4-benzoquinol methylase
MISSDRPLITAGAKPVHAPDAAPEVAAQSVQSMFDAIANRYDLLNHLLSLGTDLYWWWRAARKLRPILRRPDARVLDLCCGTGDMTLALMRHRPSTVGTAPLLAVDFSHQMLSRGRGKFNRCNIIPIEADALHLPLPNGYLDVISAAFGFRNLASYEAGLAELFRVLKPGGQIAILECNQPGGLVGLLYNLYFKRILPRIGGLLSSREAYTYLPTSVERFPRPPRMLELIREAGFETGSWTSYTFGVAGLYRATKPLSS